MGYLGVVRKGYYLARRRVGYVRSFRKYIILFGECGICVGDAVRTLSRAEIVRGMCEVRGGDITLCGECV